MGQCAGRAGWVVGATRHCDRNEVDNDNNDERLLMLQCVQNAKKSLVAEHDGSFSPPPPATD
jgi:hypothetical protein